MEWCLGLHRTVCVHRLVGTALLSSNEPKPVPGISLDDAPPASIFRTVRLLGGDRTEKDVRARYSFQAWLGAGPAYQDRPGVEPREYRCFRAAARVRLRRACSQVLDDGFTPEWSGHLVLALADFLSGRGLHDGHLRPRIFIAAPLNHKPRSSKI